MEYKAIMASGNREIGDAVNKLIKEGWQPLGGIAHSGGKCHYFTQAMVKEEQEVDITIQGDVGDVSEKAIIEIIEGINNEGTRLVVKKSGKFTEIEELGLGDMITIEKYARDVRLYDCYIHKQDRNTPITFEELEEYFQVV